MPSAHALTPFQEPRRLAIELSGCIRTMVDVLPSKAEQLRAAVAEGWEVDAFCVLQACTEEEEATAEASISLLRTLVPGHVVSCTWWRSGEGAFFANHTLKPELARFHPRYPYQHSQTGIHGDRLDGETDDRKVRSVLEMYYKWAVIKRERRKSGRRYHAVWRTRPDIATARVSWGVVSRAVDAGRYVVAGDGWNCGHHSDIDAFLPVKAADAYDALFFDLDDIYPRLLPELLQKWEGFCAEFILHEAMLRKGFECEVDAAITLTKNCTSTAPASGPASCASTDEWHCHLDARTQTCATRMPSPWNVDGDFASCRVSARIRS